MQATTDQWELTRRVKTNLQRLVQWFSNSSSFAPREHLLAMSGDIFDCHYGGGGCCLRLMGRGQDAAKHLTQDKPQPPGENFPAPNINSTKFEKSWLSLTNR